MRNISKVLLCGFISRIYIFFIAFIYKSPSENFFEALCHWDCNWYLSIAQNGYDIATGEVDYTRWSNWAFFPLFPILVRFIYSISSLSYLASALLLNLVAFLAMLIFLFNYLGKFLSPQQSLKAVVGISFFPYSFYLSVPYTESLFLCLLFLGLWLLTNKSFLFAGVVGGLLSATRNSGVFFGVIYFLYAASFLKKNQWFMKVDYKKIMILLSALLIPIGLLSYMAFLYFTVGDPLAFIRVQRAWGHQPSWPFEVFLQTILNPKASRFIFMGIVCFGFLAAGYLVLKKLWGEAIFSFALFLSIVSTGVFVSIPRYIFLSLAVFLYLAFIVSRWTNKWFWFFVVAEIVFLGLLTKFWVDGAEFMI